MAAVTKRFRDNYEFWIAHKLATGEFSEAEADELKAAIRKDLTEGPDQLREGLEIIIAAGVTMPATIDDHLERYRLWESFFEDECQQLQAGKPGKSAVGINDRIRASLEEEKRNEKRAA